MSHHINKEGNFQSDKYPNMAPNTIRLRGPILNFNNPEHRERLKKFAQRTKDRKLAEDILQVIEKIEKKKN